MRRRYLLFGTRVPYRYRRWVESDLQTRWSSIRWRLVGLSMLLPLLLVVAWLISADLAWRQLPLLLLLVSISCTKERVARSQILGWRKEGYNVSLPVSRHPPAETPHDDRDGMQRYYNP